MPLAHKLVVLTRTVSGNETWQTYLTGKGIQVYCLPTIETVPLPLTAEIRSIFKHLADYDWLVLTSATSAHFIGELLKQTGATLPVPGLKIAAIGPQTAQVAQSIGLQVTFVPSKANSTTLGAELTSASNATRILLPQTTIAANELCTSLQSHGSLVTPIPIYETRAIDIHDKELARLLAHDHIGCLTFASPSAVNGFSKRLTKPDLQKTHNLPAIAIGPGVATALVHAGFQRVYTSHNPSVEGIMETLQQLISQGED